MVETVRFVRLFYCYARRDKEHRDELSKYLRRDHIVEWYDREILPGQDWATVIEEKLNTADIILLLISADFMSSEYCYGTEMRRALARDEAEEAIAIPVILRPVHWKGTPISKLQVLPTDGNPVTSWPNPDQAFYNVADGIHKVIDKRLKEQYHSDAKKSISEGRNAEAILAYQRALSFAQDDSSLYNELGEFLFSQQQYEAALEAYTNATLHDLQNAQFHLNKGNALYKLERYEEALVAYEEAIQLISNDFSGYKNRGDALFKLGRYQEALDSYAHAIQLSPSNYHLHKRKGDILVRLGNFVEALSSYEEAMRYNPDD